jgi:hypothetical protein
MLGGAEPKVASCDGDLVALKDNSAVYRMYAFVTERVDLFSEKALKSEKTGCNKC